jgi:hypothetical protein
MGSKYIIGMLVLCLVPVLTSSSEKSSKLKQALVSDEAVLALGSQFNSATYQMQELRKQDDPRAALTMLYERERIKEAICKEINAKKLDSLIDSFDGYDTDTDDDDNHIPNICAIAKLNDARKSTNIIVQEKNNEPKLDMRQEEKTEVKNAHVRVKR